MLAILTSVQPSHPKASVRIAGQPGALTATVKVGIRILGKLEQYEGRWYVSGRLHPGYRTPQEAAAGLLSWLRQKEARHV